VIIAGYPGSARRLCVPLLGLLPRHERLLIVTCDVVDHCDPTYYGESLVIRHESRRLPRTVASKWLARVTDNTQVVEVGF
jgi:hypothetical protein